MKQFFATAALMATFAIGAFADEADGYRRTWDFTKGYSDETIQLVTADEANWEPQSTGFQNKTAQSYTPWVMVDGEKQEIAEFVGMTINSSLGKAKHVQICTTGSGLAGVPCFWLNGKGDAVTVKVPAGENVRFGYTAHGAQDRGFSCSAGFADANGATKWTNPDNQEIHEVELINSNEGESSLTLKTENGGCHIYYIIIGNGDEEASSDVTDINIAYLYDSSYNGAKDADKNPCGWLNNGGLEGDPIYAALQTYNVTAIDYNGQTLTSAELNDSLLTFDVVVAGEAVSSGNALAKGLLDIVCKVPMLNLKSFMYKSGVWSWGAGKNPDAKTSTLIVGEDYLDDPLFADLEMGEDGSLVLFEPAADAVINGNLLQGYTVSETALIADDEVIATIDGTINAIHRHGTKNQYLLIPISSDNMDMVHGNLYGLIDNAVKELAKTKSKVSAAAKPSSALVYADGQTTLTLKSAISGAVIYYTTDGSEPNTNCMAYDQSTEGIVFYNPCTVKAYVVAPGYFDSPVAEFEVIIKQQASTPAVSLDGVAGQTTITITPSGDDLAYFSFNGVTTKDGAQLYTEPIVLTEPATITVFAASETKLASEAASTEVNVGGIPAVKDTISHFTANQTDWFDNVQILNHHDEVQELPTSNWAAKAAYYWGKSAWSIYSGEVENKEYVYDENGDPVKSLLDGSDSIKYYYKVDETAVMKVVSTSDPDWMLWTNGQIFTGETSESPSLSVGDGAAAGYYAETAADLIGAPTKGKMTFGGKQSGEPYSASIQSTKKFEAPFYIVTYTTNGGGSDFNIEVQISTDGTEWTTVGSLPVAATQRYFKKGRIFVDGETEYFVRLAQVGGSTKAQVYDIYIISTEGLTGIQQVADDAQAVPAQAYDLFGHAIQQPLRGQLFIQGGRKMIVR